ncbi:hypothetical protein [Alteromonas oceanisediminis]|uniref:hypothetical protein n=1 Tax=Alteromonas oceanisediminis TaxID=2836180 RepID=UPI001BDA2B77|nr:hypothetical protein [Alteromonas oceanisediminis]MBT0585413.1 hypothetical protein [Alteromonas oceanisediminis]
MLSFRCLIVIIAGLSFTSFADERIEHDIQFITDSLALLQVMQGERQPQSIIEGTNSLLFAQLDLSDRVTFLPFKRHDAALKSESPTCTFFRVKTVEREGRYLFSLPVDIFLSPRLYQIASGLSIPNTYLDNQRDIVELADFFNNSQRNATLATMPNASYGQAIDEALAKIVRSSVYQISANDSYSGLIQLFLKRRVEFMLMYPANTGGLETLQSTELRSYGFASVPAIIEGHLMCNETQQTQLFIAQANNALRQLYRSTEFEQVLKRFTPVADQALIDEKLSALKEQTSF